MHQLLFTALASGLLCAAPALAEPEAAAASPALPAGDATETRARLLGWQGDAAKGGAMLSAPMSLDRLSSPFGPRADPRRGGVRPHHGVDVPGLVGTPVRASADGHVSRALRAGGYGNLVEIDHGDGVTTRYAHLSEIAVAFGTTVRRGDIVGLMGSTGRSTGSHLHFEVRIDGHAADPFARLGTSAAVEARTVPARSGWTAGAERLPTATID